MKKLRTDSTFARLTDEQKTYVDELLLSGKATYLDVREYLTACGITISETSISQYYRVHLLPVKYARNQQAAHALAGVKSPDLDEATHLAIQQLCFEAAANAGGDLQSIKAMYELVLKAQSLKQTDRKIKLLEEKARKADEAEGVTKSMLSDAEKMARYKEIFGLGGGA